MNAASRARPHRTAGPPQGGPAPRHRPGPLQRRREPAGPGLCVVIARPTPMRASDRSTSRRRWRPPACSPCSPAATWCRRTEADPARAWSRIRPRSCRATPTARRFSRRRIIRCRPTRCASSARRSPWWWPRRVAAAKDGAELVEIDYEPLPAVTDTARGGRRRMRRALCDDAEVQRRGRRASSAMRPATDGGVRARRPCGEVRDLGPARHRRADGAARRGRRIRSGQPAATRSMPAAAARCGSKDDLATILGVRRRTRCASSCATSAAISAPAA